MKGYKREEVLEVMHSYESLIGKNSKTGFKIQFIGNSCEFTR
jgi:hypothetical protein